MLFLTPKTMAKWVALYVISLKLNDTSKENVIYTTILL